MIINYLTDGEGVAYTNDTRYAAALVAMGWRRISRSEYHRIRRQIAKRETFSSEPDDFSTSVLIGHSDNSD